MSLCKRCPPLHSWSLHQPLKRMKQGNSLVVWTKPAHIKHVLGFHRMACNLSRQQQNNFREGRVGQSNNSNLVIGHKSVHRKLIRALQMPTCGATGTWWPQLDSSELQLRSPDRKTFRQNAPWPREKLISNPSCTARVHDLACMSGTTFIRMGMYSQGSSAADQAPSCT